MAEDTNMEASAGGQIFWTSPENMFPNQKGQEQSERFSTPNTPVWPSLTKSSENSEGSSKQDSGYCSLTPRSTESISGIFSKKCHVCQNFSKNYAQSTPEYVTCSCKKNVYCNSQSPPHLEYLETISEIEMCPSLPISSRFKHRRPVDLFDEEAMDASLYPNEMDVDEPSGYSHHDTPGLMETEETSVDFFESGFCMSLGTPRDEIKKNDQVAQLVNKEFFSPETGIFSCKASSDEKSVDFSGSDTSIPQNLTKNEEIKKHGENVKVLKLETGIASSPEAEILSCGPKEIINKSQTSTNEGRLFKKVAKEVLTRCYVIKSFTLVGIEKIDFFYQLGIKRNFPTIIQKILGFLTEKDLESVRVVSKTWNELMDKDYAAYNRWRIYKNTLRIMKENMTSPSKASSSGRRRRPGPLSPLQLIHNQRSPGSSGSPWQSSPPVSPKSVRFRSFQKAAKSLKKGERLLKCPKCSFPSPDHGSPTVQCSRSGCRHRFCIWCRNEVYFSGGHDCPPTYTPRTHREAYKIPPLGSKTCKVRLRRL